MAERYFRIKQIPNEKQQKSFEKESRNWGLYSKAFVALFKGFYDNAVKGKKISYESAREVLESTPGMHFPSGSTIEKVMDRLDKGGIVEILKV